MDRARAIAIARQSTGRGWSSPPAVVEALLAELDRAREIEARTRLYVGTVTAPRARPGSDGEAATRWGALLRTLGVKP